MSSAWVPTSVQSGLRFARRNGGKIALFTLATGSAIAAATYMRRQFRAVNESLEVERAEGARKLRAVFIANSQTVRSAFRALLPVARDILAGADRVDSSIYITKLRAKPKDRKEKQELWEKVKLASVTHLVSAVYIAAVLHSILSLQMNLLARYTNSSLDAPVQALPSGLSAATSKRFLDLARKNLLDRSRVDSIVGRIEQIVKVQAQSIGLTERVGIVDIERLCTNVLIGIETDVPKCDTDEDSDGTGERTKDAPLSSPQQWLFSGDDDDPDTSASVGPDSNYEWLVQESLDLCEILGFSGVVFSNASAVLSYALSDVKEEMSMSETRLPFAHLLPRLDVMAARIFPKTKTDDDEGKDDIGPGLIETDLEVMLSGAEESARFAASVFLSGEKENAREHREGASRPQVGAVGNADNRVQIDNLEQRDQNRVVDTLVTNFSEPGGADTDDLGLMFDIT